MAVQEKVHELIQEELDSVSGGTRALGIYRPGFRFIKESLMFFKACVGDAIYNKAMSCEVGNAHHYAVARAFLSQSDWEKFVWIEEFGSLDGFPEDRD